LTITGIAGSEPMPTSTIDATTIEPPTAATRVAPPGLPPAKDMVWIPGGTFRMGSDRHYREEAPIRLATVAGFWMDARPVTNAEFRRFVKATGYVTLAERPPDPALYPGAKPEMLVPGSVVFVPPRGPVGRRNHYAWWDYVPGANWRHPEGPASTLNGRERHPVVHVAWEDVSAYAVWAGKTLPTEAEWEFAARGGLDGAEFAWGDEFAPRGRQLANTWQGDFPWQNLALDGYERTSPVGSFPPNGYGLLDAIGNVWEWTADWYQEPSAVANGCCGRADDARAEAASVDPRAPGAAIPRKVIKGGSFLCAPSYCRRYRPAARMHHPVDTGTCHIGFRCVVRPVAPR
jgi:formylglycine-generating enzyme required for sulfatase activity